MSNYGFNRAHERRIIEWGRTLCYEETTINKVIGVIRGKSKQSARYALFAALLVWRVVIDTPSIFFRKDRRYNNGELIGMLGASYTGLGAQAMVLTILSRIKAASINGKGVLLGDHEREREKWNSINVSVMPWNTHIKLLILCPKPFRRVFANLVCPQVQIESINEYESIGRFIDISGYALSSKWRWLASVSFLINIMVAKRLKAEMRLMPQTFGPWDYPGYAKLLLFPLLFIYLKYPTAIFPREERSKKYIERFSKAEEYHPDIVLTSDIRGSTNTLVQKRLKEEQKKAKSVGIVPNMKIYERVSKEHYFNMYDEIFKTLIESGFKANLLCYDESDKGLCETLFRRYKDNYDVGIMKELNVLEIEHIIASTSFLIASRYHSIVHAYKNCVPVMAIGWAHKYEGLVGMFGQMEYCFNIDDNLGLVELNKTIIKMISNLENNRVQIERILTYIVDKYGFDQFSLF